MTIMATDQENEAGTIDLLHETLRTICVIAGMDHSAYQTAFSQQSTNKEPLQLERTLDQLETALRDTGHSNLFKVTRSLSQYIYEFHSTLHALKADAAQQMDDEQHILSELQTLKATIADLETRNSKLAQCALNQQLDNAKATRKLLRTQKEKKTLVCHTKKLLQQLELSRQTQSELQLLVHEHVLRDCSKIESSSSDSLQDRVFAEEGEETWERTPVVNMQFVESVCRKSNDGLPIASHIDPNNFEADESSNSSIFQSLGGFLNQQKNDLGTSNNSRSDNEQSANKSEDRLHNAFIGHNDDDCDDSGDDQWLETVLDETKRLNSSFSLGFFNERKLEEELENAKEDKKARGDSFHFGFFRLQDRKKRFQIEIDDDIDSVEGEQSLQAG